MNRKVGSGRPKASTIKDDHMLEITFLKGIRKCLLNTGTINPFSRLTKFKRVKKIGFLSIRMWIKFV